ncbi:hypothetical protein KIN20_021707 [Parelaphostrongylus tenuis]|uniref:Uncharacterized protein n=1 Tax=Parelaphostrongylus tenuis TaxID=148309 RepID=A0AAD5MPM9_PARTN|nr:hypothetical protein KIN20_021707 [Parelaphostrongylus tenuis]
MKGEVLEISIATTARTTFEPNKTRWKIGAVMSRFHGVAKNLEYADTKEAKCFDLAAIKWDANSMTYSAKIRFKEVYKFHRRESRSEDMVQKLDGDPRILLLGGL